MLAPQEELRRFALLFKQSPEEYDLADDLHRLFTDRPASHWIPASQAAAQMCVAFGVPPGPALEPVIEAHMAHAFYSGIAAVAALLGVDAKELERACEGAMPDEGTHAGFKPCGIEGLSAQLGR